MNNHQDSKDGARPFWLGVGAALGAVVALRIWRLRRAWQTSPLRPSEERLTALVTGASSGIGMVYATQLARRGFNVILVARRRERLEALAEQLAREYRVEATALPADLSTDAGISLVEQAIASTDTIAFLVNNAGFGLVQRFAEADMDKHLAMVRLHIHATLRLTRAALPGMLARRRGAIVNVSSLMSFYPIYASSTYASTKCYLRAFSEALYQELAGSGVRVQALCPGFVRTELQEVSNVERLRLPDWLWMAPEAAIAGSLRDLHDDRVISVPGLGYRLLATAAAVIPRSLLYTAGRLFGQGRV